MIYPETPNVDNSKWYTIMEEIGVTWEKFAQKHNLLTKGSYSATQVNFEIGNYEKSFLIKGKRTLISHGNGIFDSVFNERLDVVFKDNSIDSNHFLLIKHKTVFDFFRKKYKHKKNKSHLLITYNNWEILQKLEPTMVLELDQFHSFKINKNGLFLSVSSLSLDTTPFAKLINLCESIKS